MVVSVAKWVCQEWGKPRWTVKYQATDQYQFLHLQDKEEVLVILLVPSKGNSSKTFKKYMILVEEKFYITINSIYWLLYSIKTLMIQEFEFKNYLKSDFS